MFSKTLIAALAFVSVVSAMPNPNWGTTSSSKATTTAWPTTTSKPTSTSFKSTSTSTTSTSTSTDGGSTGPQCCQNVTNSSQLTASQIAELGLLGIVLSGLNVPIGTGCTPIDVLGGVQCNTNTVQCGQAVQNSLIGIDCIPIIINA